MLTAKAHDGMRCSCQPYSDSLGVRHRLRCHEADCCSHGGRNDHVHDSRTDSRSGLLRVDEGTGRAAWNRLFDETMAGLRFPFDKKQITEAEIFDKFAAKEAATRKKAALSGRGLLENQADLVDQRRRRTWRSPSSSLVRRRKAARRLVRFNVMGRADTAEKAGLSRYLSLR